MQCHDHITRSRLFTNEFCSGVIPFLTEQIVVCLDYWKIFCRKCVENLVVTKKCVISLSLSLSLRCRASIYQLSVNFQWISCRFFPVLFSLFREISDTVYIAPFCSHHTSLYLSGGMRDKDMPCPYVAFLFENIRPVEVFQILK